MSIQGDLNPLQGPLGFPYITHATKIQNGLVWLYGLSGSGKTTIGQRACQILNELQVQSYFLDGDILRETLNSDLSFSIKDRIENIRRALGVSKILFDAGFIVFASFITPFKQSRDLIYTLQGRYKVVQAFLDCSLGTCIARDPKGLYKRISPSMTGIGSKFEYPDDYTTSLNTEKDSIDICIYNLFLAMRCKKIIDFS